MVKRFLDGSYAAGGQFFVATTAAKTAAAATPSMFNPQMWRGSGTYANWNKKSPTGIVTY